MSELLKIFQIQTDDSLRQRTQGACVEYANQILAQPNGDDTGPDRDRSRGYAQFILNSPTTIRKEMVDQVLANPTILNAITWDDDTERWDTTGVTDDDIRYVVASSWDTLAETYG